MKWLKRKGLWVIINILAVMPLVMLFGLINFDFSTTGLPEVTFQYPEGLQESQMFKEKQPSPWWFPIHATGEWAIRWLTISLLCTPLNILFGWRGILKLKKTTGLWAFGYSALHLLLFTADKKFISIFDEVNYIFGLIAFSIMAALAITSNKKSHRLLKKAWKKMHRIVYPAAILAVLHVVLLERGWELYAVLIGLGFLIRTTKFQSVMINLRQRRRNKAVPALN